jgi:hypothetical protein
VDSTSQGLAWISVGKRTDGLLIYYKQELKKDRRAGRPALHMVAHAGRWVA